MTSSLYNFMHVALVSEVRSFTSTAQGALCSAASKHSRMLALPFTTHRTLSWLALFTPVKSLHARARANASRCIV